MWQVRKVTAICLFVCSLPIISIMLASWVARTHGCMLNEGDAHPCLVWGYDLGELLYTMNMMGWFLLISIPATAVLILMWLGMEIANIFKKWKS